VDLSGGVYDAGDSLKFGFPMAFTATILSWSVLEYGPAMEKAGQLASAQASIRWITDYLIKAHPTANELYFQV
jgi:endoglucanase